MNKQVKKNIIKKKSTTKKKYTKRKSNTTTKNLSVKKKSTKKKSTKKKSIKKKSIKKKLKIADIKSNCRKNKIQTVMSEFKNKKLKLRNGKIVTDRKQGIAIALSVANKYCQ